jgi:hypothetical protein
MVNWRVARPTDLLCVANIATILVAGDLSGDPDLLVIKEHEGVRMVTPRAFLDLL